MKRLLAFAYGIACYVAFLASFLYATAFLAGIGPQTIDGPSEGPLAIALAIDCGLLLLFALQHSIMARPAFKQMWTLFVPKPVERSTYVLFSSIALAILIREWRPIGGVIWDANGLAATLLWTGFAIGLLIVLVSTFLINHFDLFGLRQVYLYLTGREYTQLNFRTPFFYRFVRHPLYVGWMLTFWCAPRMTSAHLLFAVMTTVYMLAAIQFEERDLIKVHGHDYERYRREVPMLIPSVPRAAYDAELRQANTSR